MTSVRGWCLRIALVVAFVPVVAAADWTCAPGPSAPASAGACVTTVWSGGGDGFSSTALVVGPGMRLALRAQAGNDREKAMPVAGLMAAADGVAALNGGYYTRGFAADGLLRVDGREVAPVGTAAVLSGFLAISADGAVSLRTRAEGPGAAPSVRQCGPFLIDPGGAVGIAANAEAPRARRSVVALGVDGRVALVATSEVSLPDLARCLHDHAEGFGVAGVERALNLDGGPSTALVVAGRTVGGVAAPVVFGERAPVFDAVVVAPR
jgi:hypothetical protein